jgi:metal-sulfur cluster biosynthetic enzyme
VGGLKTATNANATATFSFVSLGAQPRDLQFREPFLETEKNMALSEEDVLKALRDCYDPELPVNIVDLGLIYTVTLSPDANSKRAFPRQRVQVEMTMTSPGCPSHVTIMEHVRNRLAGVPEISEAVVNLVWEPAWTPDRISQKAREQLGIV